MAPKSPPLQPRDIPRLERALILKYRAPSRYANWSVSSEVELSLTIASSNKATLGSTLRVECINMASQLESSAGSYLNINYLNEIAGCKAGLGPFEAMCLLIEIDKQGLVINIPSRDCF